MASRAIFLLCIIYFLLATVAVSEAREFLVGGAADGWKVPSSAQSDALNKWASANRFHVGDALLFKFNGSEDSVLEVARDDYQRCSDAAPIATYKAGNWTVPLPRSGTYYFISGAPGSCVKGERVIVVVMSQRHGRRHGIAPVHAPAPSPMLALMNRREGPAAAPAPVSGAEGRRAALGGGALLLGAVLAIGL